MTRLQTLDRTRLIAVAATAVAVLLAGFIIYTMVQDSGKDDPKDQGSEQTGPGSEIRKGDYEPKEYKTKAPLPVSEENLNKAHNTAIAFIEVFATVRHGDNVARQREKLAKFVVDEAELTIFDDYSTRVPAEGVKDSVFFQVKSTQWTVVGTTGVSLLVLGEQQRVSGDTPAQSESLNYVVTLVQERGKWLISGGYVLHEQHDDGVVDDGEG